MKDPNYRLTEQELKYQYPIVRHIVEDLGCPISGIEKEAQEHPERFEQLREEARYHNEYWNVIPYNIQTNKQDNNR